MFPELDQELSTVGVHLDTEVYSNISCQSHGINLPSSAGISHLILTFISGVW